jgi:hypothetical protein
MCNQSFAEFYEFEDAIHSYISANEYKLEEAEKETKSIEDETNFSLDYPILVYLDCSPMNEKLMVSNLGIDSP